MRSDQFFIPAGSFEPVYLTVYRSGELQARAEAAVAELTQCEICPQACKVDRLNGPLGICQTGRRAQVSSYFPHMGEEDPLRGQRGSGTIFFSNCNLRCVFCQNYDISQQRGGAAVEAERLAAMMIELQHLGCHNINLVTPDHVVPQILEALVLAVGRGLTLPIVYNTSAFTSMKALGWLDGVVDIYMPDFKIWDYIKTMRYMRAKGYPASAQAALKEMQRQVGVLKLDECGTARRGMLVRHLVMPENVAGTEKIMRFLSEEISPDTYVNIMGQYHPAGKVRGERFVEINRRVTVIEMQQAYAAAQDVGLWRFDQPAGHYGA